MREGGCAMREEGCAMREEGCAMREEGCAREDEEGCARMRGRKREGGSAREDTGWVLQ